MAQDAEMPRASDYGRGGRVSVNHSITRSVQPGDQSHNNNNHSQHQLYLPIRMPINPVFNVPPNRGFVQHPIYLPIRQPRIPPFTIPPPGGFGIVKQPSVDDQRHNNNNNRPEERYEIAIRLPPISPGAKHWTWVSPQDYTENGELIPELTRREPPDDKENRRPNNSENRRPSNSENCRPNNSENRRPSNSENHLPDDSGNSRLSPDSIHLAEPTMSRPMLSRSVIHAELDLHHHQQMIDILNKKAQDIEQYQKLENFNIMHLDWVAGNPTDPLAPAATKLDEELASKLSDEDRLLNKQIASIITSFVNDAQGAQRDDDWSKAMFFGDWLHNDNGEKMHFIEIQIKRISGDNDNLLGRCGIHPQHVWYPMTPAANLDKPDDVDAISFNPLSCLQQTSQDPPLEQSATTSSTLSITKSETFDSVTESSSDIHDTPPGIPRSLPLPQNTSWGSIKSNRSSWVCSTMEEFLDKQKWTLFGPYLNGKVLPSCITKTFVYAVRVLAIPEHCHNSNAFTGPDEQHRHATLLGTGGWLVPPLEDRIKWHPKNRHSTVGTGVASTIHSPAHTLDQNQTQPRHHYSSAACRALPAHFDRSNSGPPLFKGENCLIWRELADPCLEDVYWMVWQLLSGRQFLGFRPGSGFGEPRLHHNGDQLLLASCPFESPSPEVRRLSRPMEEAV